MAPRHQTEISADVAGSAQASGIINCRCECEGRELPDTGNAHQAAACIGRSDHPSYVAVNRHNGSEHGGTRGNQTLHGSREARNSLACLESLSDECGAERTRQSDAEYHGQAADLVLESDPLTHQLLASDDQRADGVRRQGLYMNRFEEAGSRQMR